MPRALRLAYVLAACLSVAACGGGPAPLKIAEPPAPPEGKATLRSVDAALRAGAPEMAVQLTDSILAAEPGRTDVMLRRATALAALQRHADAESAYRSVLTREPSEAEALLGLGRLQLAADPVASERWFTQAAAAQPHNAAVLNDIGVARDLQGHHAAAQEAYMQALAAAPTSAAAQANLGLSLALSGDAAASLGYLQPLGEAPGASPKMRQDLAFALTLAGQRERAAALLATDLRPAEVTEAVAGYTALKP